MQFQMLMAVWYLAVGLAGISVAAAIGVIIARIIRMRFDERRAERRKAMLGELIPALESEQPPPDLLDKLTQDRRISAEVISELTTIISGQSRERLFAIGRAAGLNLWLIDRLKAWSRHDRRLAAEMLSRFADPESLAALQEALGDSDEDVRLTTALALAERNQLPSTETLLRALRAGTRAHSLLLRRLFELLVPDRGEDVLAVAQGRIGDPSLRASAIDALGTSGRTDLAATIALMAGDPDHNVRASVLRALASLGHPAAHEVIAVGLKDPSWEVRVRAIDAVRRIELTDLIPALALLVDDEAWWVRFRAAEALAGLGDRGRKALMKVASIGPDVARRTAAMVLAERGVS